MDYPKNIVWVVFFSLGFKKASYIVIIFFVYSKACCKYPHTNQDPTQHYRIYKYLYTYIHIYTYMYTYIYIRYTYIHTCMHAYIHACMQTYIRTYILYIHTYIHTDRQTYIHSYLDQLVSNAFSCCTAAMLNNAVQH